MLPPRHPSRHASLASHDNSSPRNPALRGATTAFAQPKPSLEWKSEESSTGLGTSGALAAASTAGTGTKPSHSAQWLPTSDGSSLQRSVTSASTASSQSTHSLSTRRNQALYRTNTTHMDLPVPPRRELSRSPSHQAAMVAAAQASASLLNSNDGPRRAATTKRPAAPPKPRRLSSYHSSGNAKDAGGKSTDASSIAPTTSLVDMFERKNASAKLAGKKPAPIVVKPSGDLALASPKPLRASSGITSMIQMQVDDGQNPLSSAGNDSRRGTPSRLANHADSSNSTSHAAQRENRSTSQARPPSPGVTKMDSIDLKPPQRARSDPDANLEPVKSSDSQPPRIYASPAPTLTPSLPAQYHRLHPRRPTPNMSDDQLVSAMVASSLASSRQHSPARGLEPPPLPSRRHKYTGLALSRTPSPSKPPALKKTLRATQSDDSEEEEGEGLYPHSKRKVQKRLHKHPNKHHEGDRKRWREIVTERERKRYEGVWAANKGLHSSFTIKEHAVVSRSPDSPAARDLKDAVMEQVSNLVVREIWSRSRLQDNVLATVWDLVDEHQVGRLNKEEFVVGMWLIDGRLKGKKLPVKVSDSVWKSVKGLHGIKIAK
ncbi:hypothetical protein BDY17DRAFT_290825 [Neohortaea acidophila]|uniref:EH domain-containing protein n=1 Tax=Neohortaea acidophila TaxID=245834 RepID=A0A6A6Q3W3_9PEZI|nr:uncharacterized protein BDY17DRAFT_290825 [Neohortaea acidophila]KAF2486087.1 hypothetical protein BDY17DRAFT_290825 [Neohortaea acidophila]